MAPKQMSPLVACLSLRRCRVLCRGGDGDDDGDLRRLGGERGESVIRESQCLSVRLCRE